MSTPKARVNAGVPTGGEFKAMVHGDAVGSLAPHRDRIRSMPLSDYGLEKGQCLDLDVTGLESPDLKLNQVGCDVFRITSNGDGTMRVEGGCEANVSGLYNLRQTNSNTGDARKLLDERKEDVDAYLADEYGAEIDHTSGWSKCLITVPWKTSDRTSTADVAYLFSINSKIAKLQHDLWMAEFGTKLRAHLESLDAVRGALGISAEEKADPASAQKYMDQGLDPASAQQYLNAGFEPPNTEQWAPDSPYPSPAWLTAAPIARPIDDRDREVAKTIYQQIGPIVAGNMRARPADVETIPNGMIMHGARTGRSRKPVDVKVVLNGKDLYDIEVTRPGPAGPEALAKAGDVFVGDLRGIMLDVGDGLLDRVGGAR